MIHPRSYFRVGLASADAAAGVGLLCYSAGAYGDQLPVAIIGLLYFAVAGRMLGFRSLRVLLGAIACFSAGTVWAASGSGMSPSETATLSVLLAALLAANVLYALRLNAPRA